MNAVREQDEVAAQARSNNNTIHFGDIFGTCGAKGSELQEGDPAKKWKVRFVFRGSDVEDEYNQTAIFNGLSSSPATLEASKAVDAYGLIDGHTSSQCDAEQAYVQSRLGGTEAWVRIPMDRWPAEWAGKFRKPVVLLWRCRNTPPALFTAANLSTFACLRLYGSSGEVNVRGAAVGRDLFQRLQADAPTDPRVEAVCLRSRRRNSKDARLVNAAFVESCCRWNRTVDGCAKYCARGRAGQRA